MSHGATRSYAGRSRFAVRDGVRLRYLEFGSGDVPLVILPGITSPAATWKFVACAFPERYRVYVVDLRGRGLSDRPATGHGLADHAEDLRAVVGAAGLTRPAVLGHSLGGRIAAMAGVRMRDLLGDLIVAEPPLSGPGRPAYFMPLERYLGAIRLSQAGPDIEGLHALTPTWTAERVRERARWLRTCDPAAVEASYRGFHEDDFFRLWAQLRGRVLLMYGADSPVVTPAGLEELMRASARFAAIPGAAHMLPWDNLDGFVTATVAFLDDAPNG